MIDSLTDLEQVAASATPGPWCQHPNGTSVWQGPELSPALAPDKAAWVANLTSTAHMCQLAQSTTGADCPRCKILGIDGFTVDPVAAPPAQPVAAEVGDKRNRSIESCCHNESSPVRDAPLPGGDGAPRTPSQSWTGEAFEPAERQPEPVAAGLQPFEPMACCGRERDKYGGPNPHCECPAPFKPKPHRTDLYQEQVASRFAAGESAASLQLAYGIDDGDLMGSLRDVLRRLLGDRREAAVPVAGGALPSNPVELETTRGQLQWGLDCVAGALGRPSLLVGEHAAAVAKVMSERDAALAQVEALRERNHQLVCEGLRFGDALITVAQSRRDAQDDRDAALEQVEELTKQIAAHQEICSGADDDEPGEVDRLNPYKRSWVKQEVPTEPLASFIHGIRYYAGMLEDDDNWSHGLGHIEELCVEFDKAIHERAGTPYVSTQRVASHLVKSGTEEPKP